MESSRLFDYLPDLLFDSILESVEESGGKAIWTRSFSFLKLLHSRFHLLTGYQMRKQLIVFICYHLWDMRENLVNCWLSIGVRFLMNWFEVLDEFFSISPWSSNRSPCWLWIWVILSCILLWIVERWKNFVFLSPSFNHLILDFCFQRISSYFSLSRIWVWRFFSCSLRASVLPSLMMVC